MSLFQSSSDNKLKILQIKLISHLNPDSLRELRGLSMYYEDGARKALDSRVQEINNDESLDINIRSYLEDAISDDSSLIDEVKMIGKELAIIGLFKTIEIKIKEISKISEFFTEEKIKNMNKIVCLKKYFKNIGINIEEIDNYFEFNELRELNNCVKHSGVVSPELKEINESYGAENQLIKDYDKHFEALLIPNTKFVANLGEKIISKIKENSA